MKRAYTKHVMAPGAVMMITAALPAMANAQVIDERSGGSSNPAASIFKATLYGVGTGVVVGGAIALVENDDDISTWDSLKWGIASGAVGGLIVGVVHAVSRSDADVDVEPVDTDRSSYGIGLELPAVVVYSERDALDRSHANMTMNLLRVSY